MKKSKFLSGLFVIAFFIISCGSANEQAQKNIPANPKLVKVEFEVTGMTCAECASTIDKTLTHVYGVEKSYVSLDKEQAIVTFDANKTNVEDMKKAVNKVGYGLELKKN